MTSLHTLVLIYIVFPCRRVWPLNGIKPSHGRMFCLSTPPAERDARTLAVLLQREKIFLNQFTFNTIRRCWWNMAMKYDLVSSFGRSKVAQLSGWNVVDAHKATCSPIDEVAIYNDVGQPIGLDDVLIVLTLFFSFVMCQWNLFWRGRCPHTGESFFFLFCSAVWMHPNVCQWHFYDWMLGFFIASCKFWR